MEVQEIPPAILRLKDSDVLTISEEFLLEKFREFKYALDLANINWDPQNPIFGSSETLRSYFRHESNVKMTTYYQEIEPHIDKDLPTQLREDVAALLGRLRLKLDYDREKSVLNLHSRTM